MHAAISRGITTLALRYGRRRLALAALRRYLRDGWATELWKSRATPAYVPRAPVTIELQLTNVSELRCARCDAPHPSVGGRPGFMTPETFGRLVGQLGQLRLRDLRLGGAGEPLLHPEISVWLPQLSEIGSLRTLATSGHHLTPDRAAEVLRSVDVVEVTVAGGAAGNDELLVNLSAFRALRRRKHATTLLHARVLLQPCDVPDREELLAYWHHHADTVSSEDLPDDLAEAEDDAAVASLPALTVGWDGDVSVGGLVLGNIAETRLGEIWRSTLRPDGPRPRARLGVAAPVCHYCLDPQHPAVRKVLDAIAQQRSRRERSLAGELEPAPIRASEGTRAR